MREFLSDATVRLQVQLWRAIPHQHSEEGKGYELKHSMMVEMKQGGDRVYEVNSS